MLSEAFGERLRSQFERLPDRFIKALQSVPTWSKINIIGQSRLISLTVLVPFLGGLILFNQHLIDFLSIAPEIVDRFTQHTKPPSDISSTRDFTISRLYYVYFGLSFLGIASFFFIVFCPAVIKAYPSVHAYIEAERPLLSPPRLQLLLRDIGNDYLRNVEEGKRRTWSTIVYPESLQLFFAEVSRPIFLTVKEEFYSKGFPVETGRGPRSYFGKLGELLFHAVARMLRSFLPHDYEVAKKFSLVAMKLENVPDFLHIHYISLDYSRPWLRVLVTFCYALGFFILFIPTISTFIVILRRVLGL